MLRRLFAVLTVTTLIAAACDYAYGPFLTRVDQPVVLTGADLPQALGLDPDRATLWRWDGGWVQIPVQIDERHVVDFGVKPNNNTSPGVDGTVYGNGTSGVTALQYSDPGTFVGADPDATFDADDELVFLARDAGQQAPAGQPDPPNTVNGSGREVALTDPDGGTPGYVYLWYGQPGVDPSAGEDYVDYQFTLTSGDYKSSYKRASGPNPETSTVSTYAYDLGMTDRWKTTDLAMTGGTGTDVLDGFKARFSFSTCGRSNDTFANAHGAFVANIDGPVRAIRSYVGANSGPLTQQTWTFYPDRIEQHVDLRVHAISSIMSFIDFGPGASGMTYSNDQMGGSTVTIDGSPDTVPTGAPTWQYVEGAQGDLSIHDTVTLSFTPPPSSFEWVDDTTPPYTECWGDGDYYGAGATQFSGGIPDTDPRDPPFETFEAERIVGVWPRGVGQGNWAPTWAAEVTQSLDVAVTTYS